VPEPSGTSSPAVREARVDYPGGLRARIRWTGSGGGRALDASLEAAPPDAPADGASETGGQVLEVVDHGPRVADDPDARCRAELRITVPGGGWGVRLASTIYDEPAALLWDSAALLVVRYGFEARTGALRWLHRSASPIIGLFGSPRLRHVIVQAEIETFAIEADGTVAWRIGQSDVVAAAELVGGRLVLESYRGERAILDPASGRRLESA